MMVFENEVIARMLVRDRGITIWEEDENTYVLNYRKSLMLSIPTRFVIFRPGIIEPGARTISEPIAGKYPWRRIFPKLRWGRKRGGLLAHYDAFHYRIYGGDAWFCPLLLDYIGNPEVLYGDDPCKAHYTPVGTSGAWALIMPTSFDLRTDMCCGSKSDASGLVPLWKIAEENKEEQ